MIENLLKSVLRNDPAGNQNFGPLSWIKGKIQAGGSNINAICFRVMNHALVMADWVRKRGLADNPLWNQTKNLANCKIEGTVGNKPFNLVRRSGETW